MRLLFIALAMILFSVPTFAEESKPVKRTFTVKESEAKKEDFSPVQRFCMNKAKAETKQAPSTPTFKKAGATHSYGTGSHQLDDSGTRIDVYDGGAFILTLGDKYFAVQGTRYDDFMAGGKQVGGCSPEQMSEAINNNGIMIKKEGEEEAAAVEEQAAEEATPPADAAAQTAPVVDPAQQARRQSSKPKYSLPQ
jgi:hypothetical protein